MSPWPLGIARNSTGANGSPKRPHGCCGKEQRHQYSLPGTREQSVRWIAAIQAGSVGMQYWRTSPADDSRVQPPCLRSCFDRVALHPDHRGDLRRRRDSSEHIRRLFALSKRCTIGIHCQSSPASEKATNAANAPYLAALSRL